MTKKIKLTLIGFLTALIMLGAIFVLFPGNSKPVKAAEATGHENHALTDSNFAWSSGAQASIDAYTGENCLRFTFKLKNTALNNLLEYAPPVWGGMFNSKDYFYLNYNLWYQKTIYLEETNPNKSFDYDDRLLNFLNHVALELQDN